MIEARRAWNDVERVVRRLVPVTGTEGDALETETYLLRAGPDVRGRETTVADMDRDLGFVLAGTGHIAPRHAHAIEAAPGCRLVGVLSRDRSRAEALAARFGAVAFDDPREALARDDVDAIAVCTEHDRHVPLLHAAAEHGVHAVVDKPLALDVGAGIEAIARCDAAGSRVACVFQRRLLPAVVEVKRDVDAGVLGAAHGGEISLVWRRDAKYFAAAPWRSDPSRAGGGVLMMQAIHYVDLARHLFGEARAVVTLTANVKRHSPLEDTAAAAIRFASGALVVVSATTAAAAKLPPRVALHFELGSVVLEGDDVAVRTGPAAAARPRPRARWIDRLHIARRRSPAPAEFVAVYRDFAEAIRDGRPPIAAGRDALRSVSLVHALYESALRGGQIQVYDR